MELDKTFGDSASAKPSGVVYIVSDAELYNPKQQNDPTSWQTFTNKFISYSFSVVDIGGKTMRLKQVSDPGGAVDSFRIDK